MQAQSSAQFRPLQAPHELFGLQTCQLLPSIINDAIPLRMTFVVLHYEASNVHGPLAKYEWKLARKEGFASTHRKVWSLVTRAGLASGEPSNRGKLSQRRTVSLFLPWWFDFVVHSVVASLGGQHIIRSVFFEKKAPNSRSHSKQLSVVGWPPRLILHSTSILTVFFRALQTAIGYKQLCEYEPRFPEKIHSLFCFVFSSVLRETAYT